MRPKGERLVKARNSVLILTLFLTNQTQIEVSFGEGRGLLDDSGKAGAGCLKISFLHGLRGLREHRCLFPCLG